MLSLSFSIELVAQLRFTALNITNRVFYLSILLDLVLKLSLKSKVLFFKPFELSAPLLSFG